MNKKKNSQTREKIESNTSRIWSMRQNIVLALLRDDDEK